MGFKQLVLAILPLMFVLIQANFTDLQTEVTETKQELHNLQILVSDLRSEQKDLRQLSNDHVIVHWLKNSMMDLRREMNELAVQQERNSALDHRLENQIQQMRLDIRKPSADKAVNKHHLKILSEEFKSLQKKQRRMEKYWKTRNKHHHRRHHQLKTTI